LPVAARAVAAPMPLLAPVIRRTGWDESLEVMWRFSQTPDTAEPPGLR
jgi:hypothetical protein